MFTQDLADIYDSQAQKFSSTRQKHRPEMEHITQAIGEGIRRRWKEEEGHERKGKEMKRDKKPSKTFQNLPKPSSSPFSILEVGCGDGRLLEKINTSLSREGDPKGGGFSYTGIDISQGLLNIAKKRRRKEQEGIKKNKKEMKRDKKPSKTFQNLPKTPISFIHSDMISHLQSIEQGSVDIIVGIASVQHLFPRRERQKFFDLAQKALRPGGQLILTNRARSDWAKEKYSRPRQYHLGQRLRTRAKRTSGDQMIPRTDPDTKEVHQRYYHFFSLSEIQSHLASGRDIHTLAYIDRDGQLTQSVCQARNSLLITSKNA